MYRNSRSENYTLAESGPSILRDVRSFFMRKWKTHKYEIYFEEFQMQSLLLCCQGLEVIESTNLKYFTKEMTAEFYALKGMFLAQINK